jgi:FkbM family methyltransferase
MKRTDLLKLALTRNWKFPGKERLSTWIKPSKEFKTHLQGGIVWLTDEDIGIYTNGDSYIEWSILSTGNYEDEIGKLIRISLFPGAVGLDIGANIGLQSIRMSQAVGPEGIVCSFEPLNYLQEKLYNNLNLNKADNIKFFSCALSDQEGVNEFKINKNCWNQGTFNIGDSNQGNDTQQVHIKIGDTIPEIINLERLDLIKIDVEGFEHHVLRGLKQTIVKHKPRIIFEYDSNYWLKTGERIQECFNYLQSINYHVYQITPVGCEYINQPDKIKTGNLFCIQQTINEK